MVILKVYRPPPDGNFFILSELLHTIIYGQSDIFFQITEKVRYGTVTRDTPTQAVGTH